MSSLLMLNSIRQWAQLSFKILKNERSCKSCVTFIHTSKHFFKPKTYDGDGKTSVNILNEEYHLGLMINGFSQVGFRLNNSVTVLGPIAIFAKTILSWNVGDNIEEITEESLSLFTVLEPKIDIIVIGTGDKLKDMNFQRRLLPFIQKNKFSFEVLPTEQACSTFNFLNSEGRCVAGIMIPPQTIRAQDDDLIRTKLRYQNLYQLEE